MNQTRSNNNNNRNSNKKGKKPFHNRQKKSTGNRNYRGNNRNRPRLSEWDKLEKSYMILMEKYLHARRKYHDNFYKGTLDQVRSLERNFYRTLDEVRKFEDEVPEHLREQFDKKGNKDSLDLIYSDNHQIEPFPEVIPVPKDEIVDPHYTAAQAKAHEEYNQDTEESSGSIEDYNRYKGL